MAYILQNAIKINHNGNEVILNSRLENECQKYKNKNVSIYITGGKRKFIGNYESIDDVIIEDLRLTYDSELDVLYENMLWAVAQHNENKSYFKWIFAKYLPLQKLERILEEQYNILNPYVYNVVKYIYNQKIEQTNYTSVHSYI